MVLGVGDGEHPSMGCPLSTKSTIFIESCACPYDMYISYNKMNVFCMLMFASGSLLLTPILFDSSMCSKANQYAHGCGINWIAILNFWAVKRWSSDFGVQFFNRIQFTNLRMSGHSFWGGLLPLVSNFVACEQCKLESQMHWIRATD